MSTITDENTLFGLITPKAWLGQYAGSAGLADFFTSFTSVNSTYVSTASVVNFNTSIGSPLTHGFNTYFKMQGFNGITNQYEVWFSTGAPQLVPPSGHQLSNIEIVLTWIDR
jgi:hypothetical protein